MRRMLSIIGARMGQLVIMVFVLSLATFVLMKVTPGDPIRSILNVDEIATTTAEEEQLLKEYGFDQPLLTQYTQWLKGVVQLDLGLSMISSEPVLGMIMSRLPATLALTAGGFMVLLCITVPLGLVGALYEGRWPDYVTRWIALLGASIPSFWLGLLFIYFFSLKLNLLPVMGMGSIEHYILPSVTLGMAMAPMYIRLLRERLITTLQSSYIEAARARGLRESTILFGHALKGSLMSVVTLFGLSMGSLLGGITVIEMLFSWPGMGELIVQAVMDRDYPVIQGYILIVGCLVVLINLVVDLTYGLLNPEIQHGKEWAS
ncbi:nickel ABC transporter permease [Caldalkalibacillus salinus]|uniref:nickel ABC transporter permease n=1 Tax=Caldalkalibacillus salinus TaxID=2803787 RepID=UPI001F2C8848|nr:nickel ABC transporter permease [Caldalkalibacillus salinus]